MRFLPIVPFAVLGLAFVLPGQGLAPSQAIGLQQVLDTQCVPLHTRAPVAGEPEYGWWAGGPSWKASFHDGFTFHPYRGPERALVSLRWRTQSITVGGAELSLEPLGIETREDRYVTRYRDAREVYEIRPEGVEQLFVIPRRPAIAADLVVTGRIDGDFETPSRAPAHGDVLFSTEGEGTVRYGRAWAFDAAGRRVAVATSVEGDLMRLHVPAAFVAEARYPLTIDPLVGNALINSSFTGAAAATIEVACSTHLDQMVVAFVRQFALNDADAYSLYGNKDFTAFQYNWIDNASFFTTPDLDVAYCAGERSYVIAFLHNSGFVSTPYVYVQRDDQMQSNSGTTTAAAVGSPGYIWSEPSVGGGYGTCGKALAMWTRNGGPKDVLYCVVDCANPAGALQTLDVQGALTADDADQPDVMPMTRDGAPWRVAWHARAGNLHEIRSADVAQTGFAFGPFIYESTTATLSAPQIAGASTGSALRTIMAWQRAAPLNTVIRSFDFSLNNPVRTIAVGPLLTIGDLCADATTGSNFLLTYWTILTLHREVYVARLGGSGEVVGTETLGPYGSHGLCFEPVGEPDFLIAYDDLGPLRQIRGAKFEYPSDAESVAYGTGCATAFLEAPYPFAGNRNFAVHVRNLPTSTPVVLAVGLQAANVSLQPLGIPCPLLVSPAGLTTLAAISTGPDVSFPIPLPDDPVFLGDLHVQAVLPFAPSGGTAAATSGLRVQVR